MYDIYIVEAEKSYAIAFTYAEQVCCISQFQHYWWQQLPHNNHE